jgi:glycosyltransferase involved in cell wall biosynthesis
MKIAIDIAGQIRQPWTGIQYYTDSLLNGLHAVKTPHCVITFSPFAFPPNLLKDAETQGRFAWRNSPRARLDLATCREMPVISPEELADADRSFLARRLNRNLPKKLKRRIENLQNKIEIGRYDFAQYDLLHVPEAGFMQALHYPSKRMVATICDVAPRIWSHAYEKRALAQWERYFDFAAHRCVRVLTLSMASKQGIIEHLGIAAERIDVTPLAPRTTAVRVDDQTLLDENLYTLGLEHSPFVLYVGTLEPRKNLERLVQAFSLLLSEEPNLPHKLVLAGGNWHRYDLKIQALAGELGIGERVITTGYLTDQQLNVLMTACDAFVYISEYEGFGLPPLEAMVCGAPVITSKTSSLPEVVGDAGLQVLPTDVNEVAAALHLLLMDRAENDKRRTLSLQRAKFFSWERTAELTLKSYEAAAS